MLRRFGIFFIIVLSIIGILYFFNPCSYWFMPKCPFKLLTGLNCPGCGMQRFVYAFVHGHPLKAIQYDYFLICALPYAGAFVIAWIMPNGPTKEKISNVIECKFAIYFYVIIFFFWLVVRNLFKI